MSNNFGESESRGGRGPWGPPRFCPCVGQHPRNTTVSVLFSTTCKPPNSLCFSSVSELGMKHATSIYRAGIPYIHIWFRPFWLKLVVPRLTRLQCLHLYIYIYFVFGSSRSWLDCRGLPKGSFGRPRASQRPRSRDHGPCGFLARLLEGVRLCCPLVCGIVCPGVGGR